MTDDEREFLRVLEEAGVEPMDLQLAVWGVVRDCATRDFRRPFGR